MNPGLLQLIRNYILFQKVLNSVRSNYISFKKKKKKKDNHLCCIHLRQISFFKNT